MYSGSVSTRLSQHGSVKNAGGAARSGKKSAKSIKIKQQQQQQKQKSVKFKLTCSGGEAHELEDLSNLNTVSSGESDAGVLFNSRLRLNVSGRRFELGEHLLAKYPQSLLGSKSDRGQYYDWRNDEYFFDRNREAFEGKYQHFFIKKFYGRILLLLSPFFAKRLLKFLIEMVVNEEISFRASSSNLSLALSSKFCCISCILRLFSFNSAWNFLTITTSTQVLIMKNRTQLTRKYRIE
jgi:hypothetical protein